MKHYIFISISLSLLFLVGCGKNVGLSGKVVFSDDKSPVPLGTVGLISESGTFSARGDIKSDGTFDVGSVKANDGLPPGKYRVSVSAMKLTGMSPTGNDPESSGDPVYELLIDPKYGNPDTSELTLEITSTKRNFTIEVDRYVPSKAGKK